MRWTTSTSLAGILILSAAAVSALSPAVAGSGGVESGSPADPLLFDGMTRAQLTALYASLAGAQFQPPACVPGQEMFDDVPASSLFCPFIEELARRDITTGCGGNNFCPGAAVTRAQMATFIVRALFGRTVFVPSNGGSPAANCNKLRNRLANIDDASATNPVLVKLERGTYDCGSTPLAIKPFVTIEGAGRNLSTITGTVADFDQGIIGGANDAGLRYLTVENRANSSGTAIAIHTRGRRMSVTDVAIKVDSTTANSVFGIVAPGGALGLTNVSVQTTNSDGGSQGINASSGARLDMTNVWIHNSATAGNPVALQLSDSSATGFGVLFSSNFFGMLGFGDSVFEMVDGTVIGSVVGGGDFTGSFSCIGIADANFDARAADCS